MENREEITKSVAVASKKRRMPSVPVIRSRTGHVIAPRPHATFNMARRRARAAGTDVPAMMLPAVRPVPRPTPIQKRAICAPPNPSHDRAAQPTAVRADP